MNTLVLEVSIALKKSNFHKILNPPEGFNANFFTLKFPEEDEKIFAEFFYKTSLLHVRVSLLISILFYAGFSLLDHYLIPELFKDFFIIRFYIVIPFAIFVFLFSFSQTFKQIYQILIGVTIYLAGAGIVVMISLAQKHQPSNLVNITYYAGLILVLIFGYNFMKTKIIPATIAGFSITITYIIISGYVQIIPDEVYINNNFFLISANLMCLFSAYLFEFETRKSFFFQEQLKSEQEKIVELNQNLEIRVKERTKELNAQKIKAEESDQLKSLFLENLSHEIRTPLNGIIGFTDLLKTGNIAGDKTKRYYDIILDRSEYLLSVIDNLIDLSVIQTSQVELNMNKFNYSELLQDIYKESGSVYKSFLDETKIKLSIEIKDNIKDEVIVSDKTKVEKILKNLIKNALNFTEKGFVKMGCERKNHHIVFYVKDSGLGIPEKDQNLIFRKFIRLDDPERKKLGGIGIGLAICKAYSESLGGKLEFNSKSGKGTEFYLRLPIK